MVEEVLAEHEVSVDCPRRPGESRAAGVDEHRADALVRIVGEVAEKEQLERPSVWIGVIDRYLEHSLLDALHLGGLPIDRLGVEHG